MYCTRCGHEHDDAAATCAQCGAPLVPPDPPGAASPPANYLVQSILVTLCCCQIPGIVAIVYAAQVNGLLAAGNVSGAQRASRLAYIWCWVAFGIGAAGLLLYLMTVGIGIALGPR